MEGGTLALVMDLVEGGDLRARLRSSGTLSEFEACSLAAGVAAALGAIHSKGYIHRDIKPENTLLEFSSSGQVTPRVTDFGISRLSSAADRSTVLTGTPSYVAPELFDERRVTPAVDLYSLGIMLYEIVTGAPPFRSESVLALMRMHLDADPPRPKRMTNGLWDLVSTLLSKDPADRGGSAASVEQALRALSLETKIETSGVDTPKQPHRAAAETAPELQDAVGPTGSATDSGEEEPDSPKADVGKPPVHAQGDAGAAAPETDDGGEPTAPAFDQDDKPQDDESTATPEPTGAGKPVALSTGGVTRKIDGEPDTGDGLTEEGTRPTASKVEPQGAQAGPARRARVLVVLALVIATVAAVVGVNQALRNGSPAQDNGTATKSGLTTCWDGSSVSEGERCSSLTGKEALEWYAGLDENFDGDLRCTSKVNVAKEFSGFVEAVSCTWDGESKIDKAYVVIARWKSTQQALGVVTRSLSLAGPSKTRTVDGRTRLYRKFGTEILVTGARPKKGRDKIQRVVDIYREVPISVSRTAYGRDRDEVLSNFQDLSSRIPMRDAKEVDAALRSTGASTANAKPSLDCSGAADAYKAKFGIDSSVEIDRCDIQWAMVSSSDGGDTAWLYQHTAGDWVGVTGFPTQLCAADVRKLDAPPWVIDEFDQRESECK